ncbi:MAG: protein tyrosine phosphatase family protein [Anaerolineales bacterium]|jgi:protein tyrosine phosphatase (PTP) superfamily phosphohydrolase (DUF442 family)
MDAELRAIYNYLPLSSRIATSGQPTAQQIRAIAEAGFEVVINLALPTSDNALINEKELVETTGMRYVQIPVVWEQPTEANLASFLHAMTMYESQRVFIHCAANMRVSVFMALYRIRSLGWSRDDAMQMVYEIWKPNEIWSRFIEQNLRE